MSKILNFLKTSKTAQYAGIFILIAVIIVLGIVLSGGKNSQWVAKIENETISLNDFNIRFEYYLKSKYLTQPELMFKARNSMEERDTALRDMINERIILKEAKKMKIDQKQEVKDMIKLYTQQIILNAYIEQRIAGTIKINEKDIDDYYYKNINQFRGQDPDKVKYYISRQLQMQQYEIKLKEILEKLRDKYVIIQNENIIRPIINEPMPMMGETNMKQNRGVNTAPQEQAPNTGMNTPASTQPQPTAPVQTVPVKK